MPLLFIVLLVLVVMSFGGWGYGYYNRGAYANPMGLLGAILLVALICWLIFGGSTIWGPHAY